jgi:hypothetical protein
MELAQNKIIISPIAYIKSLMYFQRFSSEYINESEQKFAFGLLLGFIDDFENETLITDFIPIKDFGDEYLKFSKFNTFFESIEKLNQEYNDEEYPEYIVGWARNSLFNDLEPTIFDKENHLLFLTSIHSKSVFWIFNFDNLMVDDGFRLFSFKEDFKIVNITSELIELSYNFSKEVSFDDIVQIAIDIEEKRKLQETLIKGEQEK